MHKNLHFFRSIPFKIWIPVFISLLFPLVVCPILNSSLITYNEHYILDMIWSVYILPPIAFAYFYEIRGAIISSFLMQLIHTFFEYFLHLNSMSVEVITSIFMQITLSLAISFSVGLMSKRLKLSKFELEQAYKNIEKLAYYDHLTGIANRYLFMESLESEIKRHKKNKYQFAVLFLDLDGFKQVNDEFGHDTGDIILTEVVQRFSPCLREIDMFARFAGDEFIVLLRKVSYIETVNIAEKLLNVIQTPFIIKYSTISITTSIGITFYKNKSETSDSLIKQADMAMYQAKNKGKNSYQIYYPI